MNLNVALRCVMRGNMTWHSGCIEMEALNFMFMLTTLPGHPEQSEGRDWKLSQILIRPHLCDWPGRSGFRSYPLRERRRLAILATKCMNEPPGGLFDP
jgi:hypothetical protein